MSKEGILVNNKIWTMFIFNFRENLQHRIQTQNYSGQPLQGLKNYPQKWSIEDIFYKIKDK